MKSASLPAIRLQGLTKEFRVGMRGFRLRAVDGLDFEVPANRIIGLLGPNGSGKSTTLKIILGLLNPTAGSCEIFGVSSRDVRSRRGVGYLPESPYFYRFLTARELLRFFGRLGGLSRTRLEGRVEAVLEWVGLTEAADRRLSTYSTGMLQRMGMAQALIHDPELVILDEPTAGVDPIGTEGIAALILSLKEQGKTVLLCSHLLGEVEALCDGVAIIDRGKCLAQGRIADLLREEDRHVITVSGEFEGRTDRVQGKLAELGLTLENVRPKHRTLEELFREVAGRKREESRR